MINECIATCHSNLVILKLRLFVTDLSHNVKETEICKNILIEKKHLQYFTQRAYSPIFYANQRNMHNVLGISLTF